MPRRTTVFVAIAAMLGAAATLAAGGATELEAEAQRLEGLLMAPCCGATTLDLHESPAAWEMKREIRAMLAAGKTGQEILDHYVAEHGNLILAVPPARGFDLVVYVVPMVVLLVGPLLLWGRLRRGRARAAGPDDPDANAESSATSLDAEYRERLERDLRAL